MALVAQNWGNVGAMKRKNPSGLMAAFAAMAVASGYATADAQQQGSGDPAVAHKAWLECVRAAIPALDVPPATSDAVARAAMKGCADKYSEVVRTLPNTAAALAKAEREATQTAVNEVTAERIRVANAQVLKCQ